MAYDIDAAKGKVIQAGKELVRSGLIARTWGNISARISDTQFVITPSGRGYETLTPDDIVTVNIADCSYEGNIKPSSEKGVHAAAYRQRKDADFVIHTHQNYATDISSLGKTLDVNSVDPEAVKVLGMDVPTAGYGLSATKQLTDFVEKAIKDNKESTAVLMRNHGTLCIGKDYENAFLIAHTLEEVCRKRYLKIIEKVFHPMSYSLTEHCKVFRRITGDESLMFREVFDEHPDINCIIVTDAPYIRKYSEYGLPLVPYVDDLAQIVGMQIPILTPHSGNTHSGNIRTFSEININVKQINAVIRETNNAVLIRGFGGICTAGSEDDAEAVAMIFDKGCQMGLLERAGAAPIPVSEVDGVEEHRFYLDSYSKLNKPRA